MSVGEPKPYKLDLAPGVLAQVEAIRTYAKQINRSAQLIDLMEKALTRLRTDPHGWGDPEYRSKHVDAVVCHGMQRPLVIRYVIYEQVRGVVILGVKLYADFK